jgi:hypothetical protein
MYKNATLELLDMKVLKPLAAVVFSLLTFSNVQAQHHSTDTLTMSNYGQPGALIMGLGDQFNGFMIQYRVCDIWGVPAISGTVDWGDQAAPTSIFFDTLNTGRAGTIKTPQKAGTFTVKATISATCDDAWQHKHANNEVSGTATAYVYDSIPIVSFIVTCGGSSPCTSMRGGTTASGVVTTQNASPNLGIIVRTSASSPGTTVPYIIVTPTLTNVSFDIPTTPVSSATTMTVSVNSGGTTMTVPILVTQ